MKEDNMKQEHDKKTRQRKGAALRLLRKADMRGERWIEREIERWREERRGED
jgi:hypothetical protein